LHNLAGRPEHAAVKEQLAKRLVEGLRAQKDPRTEGKGSVFEAYPYANEATRNFYERYTKGEKVRAGWVNDSDFEKGPVKEPGKE
jgi:hypothetical protein